jgi:hypothetical protein
MLRIAAKPADVTEVAAVVRWAKLQDQVVPEEVALTLAKELAQVTGKGSLLWAFAHGQPVEPLPLLREVLALERRTNRAARVPTRTGLEGWQRINELCFYITRWGRQRSA